MPQLIVAVLRAGKRARQGAYSHHGAKHRDCHSGRADCDSDHGHKPLGDNSRRTERHCSHDKTKPLDGLNRRLLARCEVCFRLERLGTPAYVRGSKNALGTPTSSLIGYQTPDSPTILHARVNLGTVFAGSRRGISGAIGHRRAERNGLRGSARSPPRG